MAAPVYVGNYEYDADERELERLFDKYGKFDRVEYKHGFCFVHFLDRRDAEDCIRELDNRPWGRQERRLRVELAKGDGKAKEKESGRREKAEPNKKLFVAGFHPRDTRVRDLERAFEEFGRVRRCEIKGTYAFVEFEALEDAQSALRDLHGSKINGREINVEYVVNKNAMNGGERRGRDRDRDRERGGRSGRDSGRGRYRSRSRSYDRRHRSRSYSRSRSPVRRRRRSPSPVRRREETRGRSRSRSPYREEERREERSRSRSPRREGGSPEGEHRSRSASPRRGEEENE